MPILPYSDNESMSLMKTHLLSLDHTKHPNFSFPPLQSVTSVCWQLNDPVKTAWLGAWPAVKLALHSPRMALTAQGYYTSHYFLVCAQFKFLGRELRRLADSGSPKGSQDHFSVTLPITQFLSPQACMNELKVYLVYQRSNAFSFRETH